MKLVVGGIIIGWLILAGLFDPIQFGLGMVLGWGIVTVVRLARQRVHVERDWRLDPDDPDEWMRPRQEQPR